MFLLILSLSFTSLSLSHRFKTLTMAMTSSSTLMTNVLSLCPTSPVLSPPRNRLSLSSSPPSISSLRLLKIVPIQRRVCCFASSVAAGSSGSDGDLNPYEVLGVNPIESFDMIKSAYAKKRKDAVIRGDEATAALLERAYDKIMMAQLMKRKKGETFGSFRVSKDIKYADKEPIVPWGPRYSRSDVKDVRINMALSAVFIAWIFIQRNADWKPIQFLSFVFVYRLFEKLKTFEPQASPVYNEEGEDESRALRMGKRLLRSFCLVFGCIGLASLAFTGVLNLIELSGRFIPAALYNNQELIVTTASSIALYILASYYR